jgi:hypothetical protein
MAGTNDPHAVLQHLEQEQGDLKKQLAIIRISEPISDVGGSNPSPSKRGSDVSISNLNDPTPASLEADLTHYKVREEPCQISHGVFTMTDSANFLGTLLQTTILLPRTSD